MGEYTKINGEQVKLGTCENLYYMRFEQLKQLDAEARAEYGDESQGYRYRFPFPEEDTRQLGNYEDHNKMRIYNVTSKPELCADMDHNTICSSHSAPGGGYNINIINDCPMSKEFKGKSSPRDWRIIGICQQKQVNGELWTVVECPYCGAKSRLDKEAALELCEVIEREANFIGQTPSTKVYNLEILKRVLAGYK